MVKQCKGHGRGSLVLRTRVPIHMVSIRVGKWSKVEMVTAELQGKVGLEIYYIIKKKEVELI